METGQSCTRLSFNDNNIQKELNVDGMFLIKTSASSSAENENTTVKGNDGIQTKKEEHEWSHITEADLELKEFKCPRCSNVYNTKNELWDHMRETYENAKACHMCDKTFRCLQSMLSHSYVHQNMKPYRCPKCKYKTRTRGHLKIHFGNCANIEKFMDKRKKRKIGPSDLDDISSHSFSDSDDEDELVVDDDQVLGETSASMVMSNGKEVNEGKGKEIKTEEKDWSHFTEADLELKEFKCPRCLNSYKSTNDLWIHMRSAYSDPTVCHVCGKDLNCLPNVLSHSYVHRKVKPYHCPKCTYQSRTRFNLRVHFGSCANVEKFQKKRRPSSKRKRKVDAKKRKRARTGRKSKIDLDDDMDILNQTYDDILNQSSSETDDQLVLDGMITDDEEFDPKQHTSASNRRRAKPLRTAKRRRLTVGDSGIESSDEEAADLIQVNRNKNQHQPKKQRFDRLSQNGERMEARKWKRKVIARWIEGDYVGAMSMAQEHGMKDSEINQLIEYLYTTGL